MYISFNFLSLKVRERNWEYFFRLLIKRIFLFIYIFYFICMNFYKKINYLISLLRFRDNYINFFRLKS